MADFPDSIFVPRAVDNLPGVVYDDTKFTRQFAEDYELPAAEIVAIETYLSVPSNLFDRLVIFDSDLVFFENALVYY